MNVAFTADIDHIHQGHGIVDIGGEDADIGPCSRSDIGRTVKFVKSHGSIQYCIRPAYLHKFSDSGNGIISTRSGHLNIGPVSRDYIRNYVDIVPHGNKAYCVTEDATDAAYPYRQYHRISHPLDVDWFPISSKHHQVELEISGIRGSAAFATLGEYSPLTVKIQLPSDDTTLQEGDVVSVTPNIHTLQLEYDRIHADLEQIVFSSNDNPIQPANQGNHPRSKTEPDRRADKQETSSSMADSQSGSKDIASELENLLAQPDPSPVSEDAARKSENILADEDSPHKYSADIKTGDRLSGSESSEPTDNSEDDQSPPEPSVAPKKVDDVSAEPPESQPRTEVDTDTSASAETTDSTREPVKDSGGTEPTSTDETESAGRIEETQDTASPTLESTTSTEPPATTSELRTLRTKAEAAASDEPTRDTSSTGGGSRYQRSSAIKKYVKARADGVCEACGDPAPFETPDGQPYLEAHHVDELGQGGRDHPDKVAAVCPTCHKRIHHGEDGDTLNEALRERLEQGLADIGVE